MSPVMANDGPRAFWTEAALKAVEKLDSGSRTPFPPFGGYYCPGIGTCPPGGSHPGDLFGYIPAPKPYTANPVTRVVGMLAFLNDEGSLAHCSAAVIHSRSHDLVLTAEHCLIAFPRRPPEWFTNFVFVPAYDGTLPGPQRTPFGKWTIKRAYLPPSHMGIDDIAVLRMYPNQAEDGTPIHIEDVVQGALRARTSVIGEVLPDLQIYGYPGNDCNIFAAANCESPDVPPIHRVGQQSVCPTAARVGVDAVTTDHCTPQFGNSGGPLVVVHPGHPTDPGDVLGTVSGMTQSHLGRALICPLLNAADADADAIDPNSPCDPAYVK